MQKLEIKGLAVNYETYTERLPENFGIKSGTYVFVKDEVVIYVGMSEDLRQRVNKYFNKRKGEFDYVVIIPINRSFVFSLESALIQQLRPTRNIRIQKNKSNHFFA